MEGVFEEAEYLACCGSHKFAKEMVKAGPFSSPQQAISAAAHIWFNQVDVSGWLEAFSAHPQIGQSPSNDHKSPTSAQWSKGEQSTAIATATDSTLQELYDWNTRYAQKFGFVFLICASGRSTPEILGELKRRYSNRPLVEFEIAAQEQMKITELRLKKLFSVAANTPTANTQFSTAGALTKAEEDRVSIIGSHLASASHSPSTKPSQVSSTRTRPPITTHVLDIAHGCPASGIEVSLEMWKKDRPRPVFGDLGTSNWTFQGSSTTDKDGRSGHLMTIVDALNPGIYRISFNTGNSCREEKPAIIRKMQAVKEKLQDMNHLRKAKAEAKDEEKAEKEFAKARLEVAREERLAKEAEAMMKMHVERAAEKVATHEKTLLPQNNVTIDSELYSMSINSSKSSKLIGNSGTLVCGISGNQEPSNDYRSNKSEKLIGNSGKLECRSANNQEPSDDIRINKSGKQIGNSSKLLCGSACYEESSDDYRSNSFP